MNKPKFKKNQFVKVISLEGLDFMLGTYKIGEVFRINWITLANGKTEYRKAETIFGLKESQLEEAECE